MKIISLGSNCDSAKKCCRYYNTEAYPFDWIWSNIDFVLKTFETDFFEFTRVENLNLVVGNGNNYIFNNKCAGNSVRICSALSVHDADNMTEAEYRTNISRINEKYKRRFERLYEVLNSKEEIYFIRFALENGQGAIKHVPDDYEKLNALMSLLKNKFTASIRLLIVDETNSIQSNSTHLNENIKIFQSWEVVNQFIKSLSPAA